MEDERKAEGPEVDEYVSVVTAAADLKKARSTVLNLAAVGDLEAKKVAGRTVISKRSIAQYKARTGDGEPSEAGAR